MTWTCLLRQPLASRTLRSLLTRVCAVPAQTMAYTYKWPRPLVAADIAVVSKRSPIELLLIQRKNPPYQGDWALPGGFVDENEPLIKAAERELQEETSINPNDVNLLQIGSYGDPGRDPRGWSISVLYGAVVEAPEISVQAADDAADAQWFPIGELPTLAFDHKVLVSDALQYLLQRNLGLKVSEVEAALKSSALTGPWRRADESRHD